MRVSQVTSNPPLDQGPNRPQQENGKVAGAGPFFGQQGTLANMRCPKTWTCPLPPRLCSSPVSLSGNSGKARNLTPRRDPPITTHEKSTRTVTGRRRGPRCRFAFSVPTVAASFACPTKPPARLPVASRVPRRFGFPLPRLARSSRRQFQRLRLRYLLASLRYL
jgi:hypothetical protein